MIGRYERGTQNTLAQPQLGNLVRTSLCSKSFYVRSSGHLKPNLISFSKLNKIANVHIEANPGAQGSRGVHNPGSIAFPKGLLGLSDCSTLCGHREQNLYVQRTNATQQSSASAKKPPQQFKTMTTEAWGRGELPSDEMGEMELTLGPKLPSEDSAELPRS